MLHARPRVYFGGRESARNLLLASSLREIDLHYSCIEALLSSH